MSGTSDEPGLCIGQGRKGKGCGYVGGRSGDTCPSCGGMVLSQPDIDAAERLADQWRSWVKTKQLVEATAHERVADPTTTDDRGDP